MTVAIGATDRRRGHRWHDPRHDKGDEDEARLSDRHGVWAEVLGIGEDPEATLTIAGSGRAVPAPALYRPVVHDRTALIFQTRGTFVVVGSAVMLIVVAFFAVRRLPFRIRAKKANEEGATAIKSASKTTVVPTEPEQPTANAAAPVRYSGEPISHVIPKDDEVASELIEEVTTTQRQPGPPTIITVPKTPSHHHHDAVALYATQDIRRFSLSRADSEADAEACARHCRNLKKAFAEAGIDVPEDRIVQAAIERINFRETILVQEHREYRNYVIGSMKHAHDFQRAERRHRETIQVAKEVKNWIPKLYKVRDRSYAAFASSFFWSIVSRVLLGLAFRCRFWYQEGATGMIHRLSGYFSDRCTPMPALLASPDESWRAYLLSPLGGVYNYVSVASAGVSKTSCYVVQGLTLVVAVSTAMLLIKHLPSMVRIAVLSTCAIVLSDISYLFSGVWLAIHGALGGLIWWESREFVNNYIKRSSPSEQEMNKMYKRLDDYVNISALLPPLSVIVYSGLMAMDSRH